MALPAPAPPQWRFLAVLDFEANCAPDAARDPEAHARHGAPPPDFVNEIVELPTVLLELSTQDGEDGGVALRPAGEFRSFVRPARFPLQPFCTELCGIAPEDVAAAPGFPEAFAGWKRFLDENTTRGAEEGGPPPDAAQEVLIVTCGDWDLRSMLTKQVKMCRADAEEAGEDAQRDAIFERLRIPRACFRFCNVKKCFEAATGAPAGGMAGMLAHLQIPLEGDHHSGIDDCRNIGRVCARLVRDFGAAALCATTDITKECEKLNRGLEAGPGGKTGSKKVVKERKAAGEKL